MPGRDTSVEGYSSAPPAFQGVSRWSVVAASVCGTSHHKAGRSCQDAHYWSTLHDDVLVTAVADGAGSAMLGKLGATLAAWSAATTLGAQLQSGTWPENDGDWSPCLVAAVAAAQAALTAEARARQVELRELATTLILTVATSACVAVIQIGDGAVVVCDAAGQLFALTAPDSGEYANETTFLTSPQALAATQVRVWQGNPRHLVVFSDGLQRLALNMPDGSPHAPFFLPFFRFVETATETSEAQAQLEAFLCSRRVRERTDDDLTLLLGSLVR